MIVRAAVIGIAYDGTACGAGQRCRCNPLYSCGVNRRFAEEVLAFEPGLQELSDEELAQQTAKFRKRLADGEHLNSIQSEAFATVRSHKRQNQHKHRRDDNVHPCYPPSQ